MGPNIIKKDTFQIIGFHLITNLQELGENHTTEKLVSRMEYLKEDIPNKASDHIYVLQVYPMLEEFNPLEDNFHVVIGYEVNQAEEFPPETELYTVDKNMYVNMEHNGNRSDTYKAYDFLYNQWLEENRYTPLGMELEIWDNNENTDIYIAISK